MNKHILLVGLICLVVGVGIGYIFTRESVQGTRHMMPSGTMMRGAAMDMDDMMDSMLRELEGKTGDAFDRTFIDEMIVHHEGAIAMAEAALLSAGHEELKKLAQDIISAQTREIEQMKLWKVSWY